MGADIHARIYQKEFGYWYKKASFKLPRNYDIFGALAGVRSYIDPVVPPRGLPSFMPEYDLPDEWSHTHTHLSPDEYDEALSMFEYVPNEYTAMSMVASYLGGEVRIVLWFDS